MTNLSIYDRTSSIRRAGAIAADPRHFVVPLMPGPCDICLGAGISIRQSMNDLTGVLVDDPCPMCHGYGVIWTRGPAHFVRTVKDLLARDAARDTVA